MNELEKLKLMLNISNAEHDALLTQKLDDATDEALNYCNRDDVVDGMLPTIRKIAYMDYQSTGSELYAAESEGGRSVTYKTGDELPISIKRSLNRYRLGNVRSL